MSKDLIFWSTCPIDGATFPSVDDIGRAVLLRVGIWRKDQWDALKEVAARLRGEPIDIAHPFLAGLGIERAVIHKIFAAQEDPDIPGMRWIPVLCQLPASQGHRQGQGQEAAQDEGRGEQEPGDGEK